MEINILLLADFRLNLGYSTASVFYLHFCLPPVHEDSTLRLLTTLAHTVRFSRVARAWQRTILPLFYLMKTFKALVSCSLGKLHLELQAYRLHNCVPQWHITDLPISLIGLCLIYSFQCTLSFEFLESMEG